ncbi:MAG TPA: TIM-barrel domain-containing protein [Solirubrobacteraceae bacterium]|nr:TIM-barrel domain-containing protein [Solirubrobacteraceae bacterium]
MTRRPVSAILLAAGAALLAGGPAAAARAPVLTVRRGAVTLRTAAVRVTIDRRHYRMTIALPDGRRALSEVADPHVRPLSIGTQEDPFGSGLDRSTGPVLYAPLTFLVGTEKLNQYQGGVWGGDLRHGIRSGVVYSARRVLSVHRTAGGARLTLATDDPTGRRLDVRLRILPGGAVRVTAAPVPARGVAEVSDAFASSAAEGFFGFGGRHNAVDQHGQVLSSWVAEENLDGLNGRRTMYPNGNTAAYYPQPEFFSTRPYGFLLAQPELARFRLDAGTAQAWSVSATARHLDYIVAPGAAPKAIATLTRLSGRQPAPARWALGPMLDRLVKNAGETVADYEAQTQSDLREIDRTHLPLTAYRIEGWGFPGPANGITLHAEMTPARQAALIGALRRRHIHPLLYLRPWIVPGSAPSRDGLVARTASGAPYDTTTTTGGTIEMLDFTNPRAVRFWQAQVTRALNLGADGFMQDFGEEILFGMHFHDGQTGATMHNAYAVLYARATREAVTRYEHRHPGRHIFFFDRAGYSGLPGSAAYESANFPGDETTDFSHASGLASLTSDMLGRAVDGAYGFATDIGGYYDITTPATTRELFLRWAEWAALSPVFRLHGSGLHGTHTPWSYDAQTVRAYIGLSRLHERAAPLILRLWRAADATGMPITRPLWLADPGDPRARRQDQEWMLGPDVLVAPVVARGATSRTVFFPPGCWRTAGGRPRHGGRIVHGARSETVAAGLTTLPYFIRCGTHPLR